MSKNIAPSYYLKTLNLENREISGMISEVYGYGRQMMENPPVTVHNYLFYDKGKVLSIMVSFRTEDTEKWLPPIDKFLDSLTIKF